MFGNNTTNGMRAASEHRTDHERRSASSDGLRHFGGVCRGGTDEQRVHQAIDELPGILALPVSYGIVLRPAIRSIRRTNPAPELCTGRGDLGCDGIIGKHRHRVAALDELPHGMQFRWHIAAPIDQREQVLARPHWDLLEDRPPLLVLVLAPPMIPRTSSRVIRSVSARDSCRSRRRSFHV